MAMVDLVFPPEGSNLPTDHLYMRHAVLSGAVPAVHSFPRVSTAHGKEVVGRNAFRHHWMGSEFKEPLPLCTTGAQRLAAFHLIRQKAAGVSTNQGRKWAEHGLCRCVLASGSFYPCCSDSRIVDNRPCACLICCNAVMERGKTRPNMVPSPSEMADIARIVMERCDAQARGWGACGRQAYGAVFLKVLDNLAALERLEKSFEHFVSKTATYEARRFFRREKNALQSCAPSSAFEAMPINRRSGGPVVVTTGKKRNGKPMVEPFSMLDLLAKAETSEQLAKGVAATPAERRQIVLVHAGAQGFDADGAAWPKSTRGLATQRGRSTQHLCNLAKREEHRLRQMLR